MTILTEEQEQIVNSSKNIKINAVAGSGKTTTVVEYARSRPAHAKILYIAFNKSVKLEAIRKFKKYGLGNVRVETAHSLAYKQIVIGKGYNMKAQGYKTYELAEQLKLKGNGEKHTEYVVANHISKFAGYFCNSDKQRIEELDYLEIVSDNKAKHFVDTNYDYIQHHTRVFLSKMDSGVIDITHDFYLKKFQLSRPVLNYDYILFDEGQDASPAMLDIFLRQKATKVIVGDAHQQIYGWRHAINALNKVDFNTYHLTTSFRFNDHIAELACGVLEWKRYFNVDYTALPIRGQGKTNQTRVKAVLGRTNLGLLLKAIEYVIEKKLGNIYFEGNINSYTYADEGASLYDVLNLYNGKRQMIRDKLIRKMRDLNELEDYIKKTDDIQLGIMVEIVRQYGNDIPRIIKTIKKSHIKDDDKEKASMIFSTVHRSKGMEYDSVEIVNDFITEEKLKKLKKESKEGDINKQKLDEEINLLYVAITRTRNELFIPETLVPAGYESQGQVHVLTVEEDPEEEVSGEAKKEEAPFLKRNNNQVFEGKTYSVTEVRKRFKEAYQPWSIDLDNELTVMYRRGMKVKDLANHFGRTQGAIRSRLKKLVLN